MRGIRLTKLSSVASRQSILLVTLLLAIIATVACGGSSSGGGSSGPPAQVAQTGGSGQSATVSTAFTTPFAATVEDSKNNPVRGASVTFTAPASGPSGTFKNGTATETDATDSSGIAMSSTFTANSTAGGPYNVTAAVSGVTASVSYSLVNTPASTLTVTQGSGQGAVVGTAFASTLQVQVTSAGVGLGNVPVTFTAPSSGASGQFATNPPAATATVTTNSGGLAAAPAFTANTTAGLYTVTASTPTSPTPATITLVNASASSAPLAAGNYVFALSGTDAANSFYTVAGVFTVDGNGLITGGEQTFSDASGDSNAISQREPITYGALASTSNGNMLIILNTQNPYIGPGGGSALGGNGQETFHASLVSPSKALLTEFDNWATSSGELDLQTSLSPLCPSAPATPCGYAFFISSAPSESAPLSLGGVITIDGADGGISGMNMTSVFDANQSQSGTTLQNQAFSASSVGTPDGFGYVQFSLNSTFAPLISVDGRPGLVLNGYIIDAGHIVLIEDRQVDSLKGTNLGLALLQTTPISISGDSYVLSLNGSDHAGGLQFASVLTANSDLSVSGSFNYNDLTGVGIQNPLVISSGTYTIDTTTGRVTMTGVTSGPIKFNFQLYLTGDGNALAISMDSTDTLAGPAYEQTEPSGSFTAASFNGKYSLAATGEASPTTSVEDELDAVGAVTADGVGSLTGAGTVDLNWIFNTGPTPGLNLSGAFTARPTGVFTGTITGMDAAAPTTQSSFTYYLVDTTKVVAIETDKNQLTLGLFEQAP